MKAEITVILLQAKKNTENYQKLGERHGTDSPHSPEKEPILTLAF